LSHRPEQLKARLRDQLSEFQHLIESRRLEDAERLNELAGKLTQLRDRFLSMRTTFVQLQKQTSMIPQLEKQALLDGLTELPNRRAYEQKLKEEWARSLSGNVPESPLAWQRWALAPTKGGRDARAPRIRRFGSGS
jgi:diguanylate cyclase